MTAITLTETFDHPKEKVFAAFASAQAMARWIAPMDDIGTTIERFDFTPEGRFGIAFDVMGDIQRLAGQFLTITPHDALGFTWIWQPPAPHSDVESHVAVTFETVGTGTLLTLTHTRLNAPGMVDRHRAGWLGCVLRLTRYLKEIPE